MPYTAIITGANPGEGHPDLKYVKEEIQNISASFSGLEAAGIVRVVTNINGTERSVFNAYLQRPDIRIFHFSGHVGAGGFVWDDGNFTNGIILASMMRSAKQLKLVFLNGCATQESVDKFLENGAAVVIATSAPVFDRHACMFSSNFYEALCEQKLSIGQSFDFAKRKLAEALKANPVADLRYKQLVEEFAGSETARSVGNKKEKKTSGFKWGLYQDENLGEEEKTANENWTAVFASPLPGQNQVWANRSPSLALLRNLAQSAISLINDDAISDERRNKLEAIRKKFSGASSWANAQTNEISALLQSLLLQPLCNPFQNLANQGLDSQEPDTYDDPRQCLDLLDLQLGFYNAFIRTASIMMLSNFVKCIMLPKRTEDQELKELVSEFLRNTKTSLPALFEQLIEGQNQLGDMKFCIRLMREIVRFFAEARAGIPEKNMERYTKVFEQFVEEYNGNAEGSNLERSLQDSIHQEFFYVLELKREKVLNQIPALGLRGICDRLETALIELLKLHKYILKYEIIPVGRIEANRRWDIPGRIMNHEVYLLEGLLTCEMPFGENVDFTENYGVLLVSHRDKLLNYLSLSPFIINIGAFINEKKPFLYYFSGKANGRLMYTDFLEESKSKLQINIGVDQAIIDELEDNTFLTMSADIQDKLGKKDEEPRIFARRRFYRVKQQYGNLEEQFQSLIAQ